MRLVALALVISLGSCTITAGVVGGELAAYHNASLPDMHPASDERSLARWILIPAAFGLLFDLVYLNWIAKEFNKPLGL